jgi:hypothetical protein
LEKAVSQSKVKIMNYVDAFVDEVFIDAEAIFVAFAR